MKPHALRLFAAVTILPLLFACGDQGASQPANAAPTETAADTVTRASAIQQDSPAPRLAALPRQIRDYHQTTYVDECRAYENSTLTVREPGYVTTADFNGDGRADYVLSGTHLECSAGASYICGNGTCPFDMFLSQGEGFTMVSAVGHEGALTRQGGSRAFMVTAKTGQLNRLGPAAATGGNPGTAAAPTTVGNQASAASFTVNVSLSPQAAARLQGREGIVLRADITGQALPARESEADDMGDIDLGSEEVTAEGKSGPVRLTGRNFKPERRSWIKGSPYVNVNIYTARRSSPDNLIVCQPPINGDMAAIVGRTHEVRCSLITEG